MKSEPAKSSIKNMPDLTINTDLAKQILIDFLKTEITRAGFKRAVVGVSGGIDSAVSCVLATEALGPKNVLAVCMPYKTSSTESLTDAQALIEKIGVQSEVVPISEMVDPFIARFPQMDAMRKGNIMARMRMIVLYDRSAEFSGLVVGTGNKTEILLGYTTLFGDSACGLNPVGDLYKTQLRQLAKALDIPEAIQKKAPTADLWKGQTDEGELGYTYAEVDQLLYMLVDQHRTPAECIEAGMAEDFVKKVVERVRRNTFKRILPPIARWNDNSGNQPGWGT